MTNTVVEWHSMTSHYYAGYVNTCGKCGRRKE
jgi:hypothetical protein